MKSPANLRCPKPTFNIHFNLHQKSPQYLSFPFLFRVQEKSTSIRFPTIRASSSSSPSPKPSLLKTTCISLTVAAAVLSGYSYCVSRLSSPMTVLQTKLETKTKQNLVESLLSQTKIKFELGKYEEAIQVLNRLIQIDPVEPKWPAMKARILSYNSQNDLAIKAFEEILRKDPTRIDAYHYLVIEYYNSKPKLAELEKRINKAIQRCKKKKKEICNFKMLIAQIRLIEGNLIDAIQISEEVVKNDPEDFNVYMFQGVVYALMSKREAAMEQFEQGYKVFPEDHHYLSNQMDSDEWQVMLDYDSTYCYCITFGKLAMDIFHKKFGFSLNFSFLDKKKKKGLNFSLFNFNFSN